MNRAWLQDREQLNCDVFAALWAQRSVRDGGAVAAAIAAPVRRHGAAAGAAPDAVEAAAAAAGRKAADLLAMYGRLPSAKKCSDSATHVCRLCLQCPRCSDSAGGGRASCATAAGVDVCSAKAVFRVLCERFRAGRAASH